MAADSGLLVSLVEEFVSGLQDSKADDTATGKTKHNMVLFLKRTHHGKLIDSVGQIVTASFDATPHVLSYVISLPLPHPVNVFNGIRNNARKDMTTYIITNC